jgi:hypothetical protein
MDSQQCQSEFSDLGLQRGDLLLQEHDLLRVRRGI